MKPKFADFRERFDILRAKHGPSNTEFAKFLGMSRQTVGFYLNGDRVPDIISLAEISKKCGVSADWLLGLSSEPTTDPIMRGICDKTGLSEQTVLCMSKYVSRNDTSFGDFLTPERFQTISFWLYSMKKQAGEVSTLIQNSPGNFEAIADAFEKLDYSGYMAQKAFVALLDQFANIDELKRSFEKGE